MFNSKLKMRLAEEKLINKRLREELSSDKTILRGARLDFEAQLKKEREKNFHNIVYLSTELNLEEKEELVRILFNISDNTNWVDIKMRRGCRTEIMAEEYAK